MSSNKNAITLVTLTNKLHNHSLKLNNKTTNHNTTNFTKRSLDFFEHFPKKEQKLFLLCSVEGMSIL